MSFRFNGRDYEHFIHAHNNTARNERKVELPLAFTALKALRAQDQAIVEIGAVLHAYTDVWHWVVDWYEKGEGIDNRNALEVDLTGFNCISVSTIEHFGREEHGHNDLIGDDYPLLGLKKIMDECPSFFVTWGTGFNQQLDQFASENHFCYLMKDFGKDDWRQSVDQDDFLTPYPHHLGRANAFVVATNIKGLS